MSDGGEIRARPGEVQRLAPGLRVVLAPNPSPMTLNGTNSYILGEGRVAVIDPGPADPGHLAALLAGLAPGETVSHILVTHAHLDHSPLARPLAEATGAPVLAFGDASAGRSALMERLAAEGGIEGGEGVAAGVTPD
ncbi:MAG: MBL fold metallo-hydrolase, partial [Rhodobacteraceae bacterium]|nr:MBL fold metallo-hydrolase [Paracoccaceae bacterium]